ncbi:MAG: beta-agarase, partial [Alphaproteobacteria bacterium]|nr:beta-agarase [Alphaproteobacteria bacterium]
MKIETFDAAIQPGQGGWSHVVFAKAEQPAVLFKAPRGTWDWSATSKLRIPVENPGDEPLPLMLRVESAADQSLRGSVTIAPHSAGDLTMWLEAPLPRSMGMVGGPPLMSDGREPNTWPVRATGGSVDASHVTSVRLATWRPPAPRPLTVGPLRVEPPSEADKTAYDGIVDGFGQYRPGSWPEKVNSVDTLRRRGEEEARQIAQWRAQAPKRDRFGGLLGSVAFRATGFFRTERSGDRWWLVTPEGNPFFSIGMDTVSPGEATYITGREFMFRDLPPRDGEFAAQWSQHDDRRGLLVQRGRAFDHGLAFDFFTANLERKFGADWRSRWRGETVARLEAWGFNTIGSWGDPGIWAMHRLPYTVQLSPEGEFARIGTGQDWWGPMADPFDPRFAEAADRMARNAAAKFRGDPYLLGYFVDNELSWGRSSGDPHAR